MVVIQFSLNQDIFSTNWNILGSALTLLSKIVNVILLYAPYFAFFKHFIYQMWLPENQ
jgi:hypothetical protein